MPSRDLASAECPGAVDVGALSDLGLPWVRSETVLWGKRDERRECGGLNLSSSLQATFIKRPRQDAVLPWPNRGKATPTSVGTGAGRGGVAPNPRGFMLGGWTKLYALRTKSQVPALATTSCSSQLLLHRNTGLVLRMVHGSCVTSRPLVGSLVWRFQNARCNGGPLLPWEHLELFRGRQPGSGGGVPIASRDLAQRVCEGHQMRRQPASGLRQAVDRNLVLSHEIELPVGEFWEGPQNQLVQRNSLIPLFLRGARKAPIFPNLGPGSRVWRGLAAPGVSRHTWASGFWEGG